MFRYFSLNIQLEFEIQMHKWTLCVRFNSIDGEMSIISFVETIRWPVH